MTALATQRDVLVTHGQPAADGLHRAGVAQIAALGLHWHLIGDPGSKSIADDESVERCSLLERLYRHLDTRLFGRGKWALAGSGTAGLPIGRAANSAPWHLSWRRDAPALGGIDRLCVEYEGLPMARLEQAVRQRLGQPDGTVCARVWLLQAALPPRMLIEGWLRLDHRSLLRSVLRCAAKLPALLHAAWARRDRPTRVSRPLEVSLPMELSAVRQLWRLARSSLTWLLYLEQWQVEVGHFSGDMPRPGVTTAILRPPNSAFWADPFLLRRGPRMWVLFEELPFDTNRGHISAVEIDDSGKQVSAPQVVLKESWHLSYPFLWHEGGRVYMIPESGTSRQLTLYEAVDDGPMWRRRMTLISGMRLADATVTRYGGRLWMFATCADDGAFMDDTLHIFWADAIEGPWHSHVLNPVKIDASSSRPAGSMWVAGGALHRVVQDCASTYGGNIHCMRITRLTEEEFEEEPVKGWAPRPVGANEPWHTFNAIDNMTVIDRLVRLPRWRAR